MTNTSLLDNLTAWVKEEICSKIRLKVPNDKTITSEVELANPAAFALFVPAKDRLPPNVAAPIPSICVQLMEGEDKMIDNKRYLQIRLCLACWSPGTQSGEIFTPHKDESAPFGVSFTPGAEGAGNGYQRNLDGWRDSWNFVDLALRKIENTEFIAGARLVKEEGVKYGPFTEEGAIWDLYPYWHSWITFKLETGLVNTHEQYTDLL